MISEDKRYEKVCEIISRVRDHVYEMFRKGKSKENLHNFTGEELKKNGIGFPRAGESYRKAVERCAEEGSSDVFPNGTDPYEELLKFFGIKI